MIHAVLLVERTTRQALRMQSGGDHYVLLEDEALAFYERDYLQAAERVYSEQVADVQRARAEFVGSVTVREGVVAAHVKDRAPRDYEILDQVVIGGSVMHVPAGEGHGHVRTLMASRFPEPERPKSPTAGEWWAANSAPRMVWQVSFVTAAGVRELVVDPSVRDDPRLPVMSVVLELDRAAEQGWQVHTVSEDRWVDEATGESVVVRARHLLVKF